MSCVETMSFEGQSVLRAFISLTRCTAVGMFRFIEGQKGLTCKPFLQLNQDTVS